MFIESLKSFVITLVTVLIFISAVELISPDSKIKKYIRFVLGLILISVILNPILHFVSNGEKTVVDNIKSYEEVFSENEAKVDLQNINNNDQDKGDNRKKAFVNNFNKNCDNLLKNKFKDMTFKSDVDCDVDFNKITFNVKKLKIGVSDNKVKKVKKIVINDEVKSNSKEENSEYGEVQDYISSELDIPKEKIEVYQLDE
ncbi:MULTISPECIES: stage III sporulation protein AF [unclassified Clostridium]|uniref:stage III sporulation protein AF n=1 Tax=unclassified Clostridium TaxID=2614128 RepID=UPI0002977C10|nr:MULTISPECIES: stage III sporulation protein AF [unclassified Clostridium]EKQ58208.1 MAG: stage III sporulation protein AF [Clostridium sp. Maddingley MBC34-26]